MEWVVEKVLPREVRKLAETIDVERHKVREKDSQLALLNDELTEAQEHSTQWAQDVLRTSSGRAKYVPSSRSPLDVRRTC